MAVVILTACGHDDIVKDTPAPKPDIPTVDTTSPVITVHLSSVDITGVEEILISGNQLHVGDKLVASWTDNVTKSCQVKMTFDGSPVSSGNVPDKS